MNIENVDSSSLTNVMKQYYDIKIKNLDKIVLFQLGDFYEMFFEDASRVAKDLELTLTSKNAGLKEKIPMCGVPSAAKNEYIKKLIDLHYSMVVVEQIESANLGKKLVDRKVVKIVTPGTYAEDNNDSNNFVGSLSKNKMEYLFAYGDIATGELFSIKINNFHNIINEMKNLNINELIIDDTIKAELIEILKENEIYYTIIENLPSIEEKNYKFKISTVAQKNLIGYLNYTQINKIEHLKEFVEINIEETMFLSNNSQTQLELIKGITDNTSTLYYYLNETKTAMGRRLLKQFILHPLVNQKQIMQRHDIISTFLNHPIEVEYLQEKLKVIYDFERLVGKISDNTINPRELENLKKSLKELPFIYDLLVDIEINNEELKVTDFDKLEDLSKILEEIIIDEAPSLTKEGNFIKDGFSKEVDEYRNLKKNSNKWLTEFEAKEIEKTGIKNLRIKYNKIFGYFLEVTNSNLDLVPEYYIRKQTMTGGERFITTELKEEERKILNASELLLKLELDILNELRNGLKKFMPRLQKMSEIISKIDVLLSFAIKVSIDDLIRPEFTKEHKINIQGGKHPIIAKLVDTFIENDIYLNENNIQIITGPNMAGKSTYMRMLGIIAIMAQIGCYVPCEKCEIKIFDSIFTRIGAGDDISKGQSTFMMEMLETKEAIENATENSLLIFDELGRGTSTYDGIALAKAIIIYIAQKIKAKTLFSTHYHELLDLVEVDKIEGIETVHVKAVNENGILKFYHKVMPGGMKKSYGIEVANLSGINLEIINLAQNEFLKLEKSNKYNTKDSKNSNISQVPTINLKKESEVEIYLKNLDIENITPIEALTKLNELKEEYEKSQN